ncbi:hypothetical protein COOONC_06970 [Cooperia oncophora]
MQSSLNGMTSTRLLNPDDADDSDSSDGSGCPVKSVAKTCRYCLTEREKSIQRATAAHVSNAILAATQPFYPAPVQDAQPDRPIGYGAFGVVWLVCSLVL